MRDSWEFFDKFVTCEGETLRDRNISRAKRDYRLLSRDVLSRKTVAIDNDERVVLILSGSTMHVKTIISLPDEPFYSGQYVVWNDVLWLICETDMEDEIYYRGTIRQCNKKLRWQNADGKILERWAATEDKVSNAHGVDTREYIDKINSSYNIYLPLDEDTVKIRRYQRFIMDADLDDPDTYVVKNRNVITTVFDTEQKHGVIVLTLAQDEKNTDNDSKDMWIADYEKPKDKISGTRCEIRFNGKSSDIKAGGSFKTFTAVFYDEQGNVSADVKPKWKLTFMPDTEKYYHTEIKGDTLKIKADNEPSIIMSQIRIDLSAENTDSSCTMYAKVVYVL